MVTGKPQSYEIPLLIAHQHIALWTPKSGGQFAGGPYAGTLNRHIAHHKKRFKQNVSQF